MQIYTGELTMPARRGLLAMQARSVSPFYSLSYTAFLTLEIA